MFGLGFAGPQLMTQAKAAEPPSKSQHEEHDQQALARYSKRREDIKADSETLRHRDREREREEKQMPEKDRDRQRKTGRDTEDRER